MAVSLKVLIAPVAAAAAQTTQYTAVGLKATIDKFTAINTGAAAADLSVHLVQNGSAAAAGNMVVKKTLAVGETYTFPEVVGHNIDPGGFISTIATAANSIYIRASGREAT